MPNRWTFKIKPIKALIERYVNDGVGWIDPFAGKSEIAQYRNDLNPDIPCEYHLEAVEFVNRFDGMMFKGVLFDPPYSGRQVKECYSHLNRKVHRDDTNSYFYANIKRTISPKIEIGGYAISCGWNTNGFGKSLGFEIVEILLVPHGSSHNDTIITVEIKMQSPQKHAPDKIGGESSAERGQAWADDLGDELPES